MKQIITSSHLLRWLLLAFLVGAFGAARPAQAQVTASPPQVVGDDVQVTYTNKTCNDVLVGLVTYCVPKDDTTHVYYDYLNAQVLYCYTQGTVKAGKCLTLSVDIPWTCQCPTFQADAFTGCVIPKFHNDDYGSRILTYLITSSFDPWAGWGK